MGKASTLLFFLATYNLLTVPVHNRSNSDASPLLDPLTHRKAKTSASPPFHVAVTATDSPYIKWQCRIMYYCRRKLFPVQIWEASLAFCIPDNLMDEIPTFVVDPLPPGLDQGYVVLNRPWAFVQWLERATIKEDYVLMAEPDHIFVNPLPNLAAGESPAGFPFFYITPQKFENIVRKYYPVEMGPVTDIDPIGNSPVIISKMRFDYHIFSFYVLRRYGYAIASALHGPPWDLSTKAMFIIHYTYACDYNLEGELTYGKTGDWRFDKRLYLRGPPPKNIYFFC
ncbi:LOW QUALITY PROTEIN: hypothetical protein N665_0973s0009 [Sinapis alba]|nr:LOW QUALITY PROTEIN: hypothetical protein N665_0973s0009 [Sinapis alba]